MHQHLGQRQRDGTRQDQVAARRQRQPRGDDDHEGPDQPLEERLRRLVQGGRHFRLDRVEPVGLRRIGAEVIGNLLHRQLACRVLVATLERLDGGGHVVLDDEVALLLGLAGHLLLFGRGERQVQVFRPGLLAVADLRLDAADGIGGLGGIGFEDGAVQRRARLGQLSLGQAERPRGRQVVGIGFFQRRVGAQIADQPERAHAREEDSQNEEHQGQPGLDRERFHVCRATAEENAFADVGETSI